ncbi:MAG TPA: hypothetical protein DCS07_10365 [Bdellovibrionales bacterium]|nr:MAG: hypothetical protein A2Z97_00930 [Bdellovibrionales bacterium GWB1_52_6]OFZ03086.1 MAG: hypothetical protein A2X97_09620 [Bdellovibrionales bacterium GWA1_52_35]OFZ37693.1 MAG: hypothetical protein A2070_13770 [Bdellovibrionales bacterium GWC1_52_8]HAR43014.1 hypothetical protein [Bdellovibrionales bacterium]HCM40414.1 hypothetical protein [Bdellovibrionales bacterium]
MKIILLLVLFGTSAHAAELTFKLDSGKSVKMTELRERTLLLNSSCVKNSEPSDCKAWKLAQVSSATGIHPQGGQEPGALVCAKLGGRVQIAKDSRNNEEAFCGFSDGSLISCGSLYAIALKNSLKP